MLNPALQLLQQSSLKHADFNEHIDFLFDKVLAKRLITLFYADGGNGKSWLAFALAKHCVKLGLTTVYCDFDNPLSVLKERHIDANLIHAHSALQYIQRGKCPHSPQNLLAMLDEQAVGDAYDGWVIFIDSLRNFCNVNNEQQSMDTMNKLMNLREAGATIVILHHSNKDGKNYQGSNNIRNSVDNMYQVIKLKDDENEHQYNAAPTEVLRLHLKVKKERAHIESAAYQINTKSLAISQIDAQVATLQPAQEAFTQIVLATLAQGEANKTQLLEAAGKSKDDKTARNWLDAFDGKLWLSCKKSGVFSYSLIHQQPSNPAEVNHG